MAERKNLNKLILISFCTLLSVVSCTQDKSRPVNEESNNRIKLNEVCIINGYRYSIIDVDGKEYLTQDNGGFVEITK